MKVKELIELLECCDADREVRLQINFWNAPDECSGFEDDVSSDSSDEIHVDPYHGRLGDKELVVLIESRIPGA